MAISAPSGQCVSSRALHVFGDHQRLPAVAPRDGRVARDPPAPARQPDHQPDRRGGQRRDARVLRPPAWHRRDALLRARRLRSARRRPRSGPARARRADLRAALRGPRSGRERDVAPARGRLAAYPARVLRINVPPAVRRGVVGSIPVNIADYVGGTPIVQLTRMVGPDAAEGVELYAKVESFNPGGSVKDRIGIAMVEAAEAEGRIEPGRTTIVEATSGNTGIALAFVCAAKGYDLVLTLPQGMTRERERLLRLYGARVEIIESLGGMNEAVEAARALARRDDVWMAQQFSNPANPEAHRRTTGPEILDALGGVDAFVAGVGTGGTITGTGQVLKERDAGCLVVAVEPA